MGGFIVGFDSDTPNVFQRQIDFIQQSGIVTAMVGLLQAPFGTRLHQRMDREGRLTQEMSGDNADGSTNIVPLLNPDVLHDGYRHIIQSIYSPELFYARIKTFITNYHPPERSVKLTKNEIQAFFRSIWHIGFLGSTRRHYWNLFFWSLFRHPRHFPLAITLTIYGYHFQKVGAQTLKKSAYRTQPEMAG